MRRIIVVGSTGSGKSTMARHLSQRLGIPHVELDAFRWDPNWTEAPDDIFRMRVAEAAKADAWIMDGNYSLTRDITWSKADTIVWLDFSFPLVFIRLTRRIIRRSVLREVLWNGNVENGWKHFFTKDSLYLWLWQSHWRRRRGFEKAMTNPTYSHITFVRLKSARAAKKWLAAVR